MAESVQSEMKEAKPSDARDKSIGIQLHDWIQKHGELYDAIKSDLEQCGVMHLRTFAPISGRISLFFGSASDAVIERVRKSRFVENVFNDAIKLDLCD